MSAQMSLFGAADTERNRRAFVRAETERLGRFLDVDHLVGWRREYRCDCGYRCTSPGDIFDHALGCGGGQ